jgi:hypothetical protein
MFSAATREQKAVPAIEQSLIKPMSRVRQSDSFSNSHFISKNQYPKLSQRNIQRSHFKTNPQGEITDRAFTEIYEIDKEIVMNILDVETLVKLYNTSKYTASILNDRDVLENLVKYYNLPGADNFTNFLQAYDKRYVTPRCTNYYDIPRCYYRAIEQDNYEMIQYFKKLVKPNTVDVWGILGASAGGNYETLKETLDNLNLHRRDTIKINYAYLLQKAIENNKPKNFELIFQSASSDYRWNDYDIARIATMHVKDIDFYKEILKAFPNQAIMPRLARLARHWPIFEYILSLMPTRPDYSEIIFDILTKPNAAEFLEMIEKKYGSLFTPQEIHKIIISTSRRFPGFSELMFEKYYYKLPVEMIKQLTVRLSEIISASIEDSLSDTPITYDVTDFLFKIIRVNPDLNYNKILQNLIPFGLDTFYQVLKVVPPNYKINYQELAAKAAGSNDYDLLKDIFDMAPPDYGWSIEPIVENLITDHIRRSEYESRDLPRIMELLISMDPNLDYVRLLKLADQRKDSEIAKIFKAYYNRRPTQLSKRY